MTPSNFCTQWSTLLSVGLVNAVFRRTSEHLQTQPPFLGPWIEAQWTEKQMLEQEKDLFVKLAKSRWQRSALWWPSALSMSFISFYPSSEAGQVRKGLMTETSRHLSCGLEGTLWIPVAGTISQDRDALAHFENSAGWILVPLVPFQTPSDVCRSKMKSQCICHKWPSCLWEVRGPVSPLCHNMAEVSSLPSVPGGEQWEPDL